MSISIVNVLGFSKDEVIGSTLVISKAWYDMSAWANITVVNPSRTGNTTRRDESNYLEFQITHPKPSTSKLLQRMVSTILPNYESHILTNVDSMWFALFSLLRLRRVLGESSYVHSYNFWFVAIASVFPRFRKKLVYTELGGDWKLIVEGKADLLRKIRYKWIGRNVLNRIRVISQNPIQTSQLIQCGLRADRIRTVRHGRVDPTVFHKTSSKKKQGFVVLFLGRLVPIKGVHILIEAIDLMISNTQRNDIKLVIAGPVGGFNLNRSDSQYQSTLKTMIAEKGLSPFVEFKGFLPLNEVIDLYSLSDVYVLPSFQDACPSSVVEAMMCSTPVIGTTSGGMSEQIIEGKTGFLVPPGDAQAIADKLIALYNDTHLRRKMGEQARKHALTNFSTEQFSEDLFSAIVSFR